MSDEETKGEAVALTDEERSYEQAKRRYREAGRGVDSARKYLEKARKKLCDWEDKHGDDNDRYRELNQDVKDENELLKDAKQLLKYANQLLNACFQQLELQQPILEPPTATPFSPLIPDEALHTREGDRKRMPNEPHRGVKKPRCARNSRSTTAEKLMRTIRDCNVNHIFDMKSTVELPFPSLWTTPNRFNERTFTYQARSSLKPLYDKIVSFWLKGRPITVKVAGTIGYGKSHMLAVLVLLLLKHKIKREDGSFPFVCYIPDCRELWASAAAVVTILKQNIVLNMPDFSGKLTTIEDIRDVLKDQRVILVADRWNVIVDKDKTCRMARERLLNCFGTSRRVTIHGASMDTITWRELFHKNTSEDRSEYSGGVTGFQQPVTLRTLCVRKQAN